MGQVNRAKRGFAQPQLFVAPTAVLHILGKTLARGPIHGHGIAVHVRQVSDEVLRIAGGSLYPALHRIEQAGLISSGWRTSENHHRAKYYRITVVGRRQLAIEEENWRRLTRAVSKVLRFA